MSTNKRIITKAGLRLAAAHTAILAADTAGLKVTRGWDSLLRPWMLCGSNKCVAIKEPKVKKVQDDTTKDDHKPKPKTVADVINSLPRDLNYVTSRTDLAYSWINRTYEIAQTNVTKITPGMLRIAVTPNWDETRLSLCDCDLSSSDTERTFVMLTHERYSRHFDFHIIVCLLMSWAYSGKNTFELSGKYENLAHLSEVDVNDAYKRMSQKFVENTPDNPDKKETMELFQKFKATFEDLSAEVKLWREFLDMAATKKFESKDLDHKSWEYYQEAHFIKVGDRESFIEPETPRELTQKEEKKIGQNLAWAFPRARDM